LDRVVLRWPPPGAVVALPDEVLLRGSARDAPNGAGVVLEPPARRPAVDRGAERVPLQLQARPPSGREAFDELGAQLLCLGDPQRGGIAIPISEYFEQRLDRFVWHR